MCFLCFYVWDGLPESHHALLLLIVTYSLMKVMHEITGATNKDPAHDLIDNLSCVCSPDTLWEDMMMCVLTACQLFVMLNYLK